MPYPNSSAVGAEALDRIVAAQHDNEILVLVDIPAGRPGSTTPLEYLPEAERRETLQEWTKLAGLEDSVVWKTLHGSFLESVGKMRVFSRADVRATIEAGVSKRNLERIVESSVRYVQK